MRTLYKKIAVSGTPSATTALELKVQEHSKQTWEFLTTSANVKVILQSVFTDEDGTEGDVADIQTINLTADVLTIVNFDMKLEHVRCQYDDTGSSMSGILRIKATTAK
jgi:hypothetical protein